MAKKNEPESLFWADQIANKIINMKRFKYLDKPVPSLKDFTVKTSASLSGALHIGRLSDTIRGETVQRALADSGVKSRLIWVAEDMDPLRKVPKGVPDSYEKHIGKPVTDIPDPDGNFKSYAERHVTEYFKVIDLFVAAKMKKYSMRQEYKKGNFAPYIKKILENTEKVVQIQNKYRSSPLPAGWSPWNPICDNCGKIITTHVTGLYDGIVSYQCKDYSFENAKARGCGHKGDNDPMKFNGKLAWKSEWAAQWARWRVVSEGAGKEYQVPMSAWWVNAEIVERVLGFPMPEPIFYEHIMIDSQKMSASLGNVVYPKDWLEVAPPELLRFFYNKKLMKTRSFSWQDLPKFYDDYDDHAAVYFGKKKHDNRKEEQHMKRLFEVSQISKPRLPAMPFSQAVLLSQVPGDKEKEPRIDYAAKWVEKYSPESAIRLNNIAPKATVSKLNGAQKNALNSFAVGLKKAKTEYDIKNLSFEVAQENGLKPQEFFRAAYLVLLGKEKGPRLAPFVMAVGKAKIVKLLEKI